MCKSALLSHMVHAWSSRRVRHVRRDCFADWENCNWPQFVSTIGAKYCVRGASLFQPTAVSCKTFCTAMCHGKLRPICEIFGTHRQIWTGPEMTGKRIGALYWCTARRVQVTASKCAYESGSHALERSHHYRVMFEICNICEVISSRSHRLVRDIWVIWNDNFTALSLFALMMWIHEKSNITKLIRCSLVGNQQFRTTLCAIINLPQSGLC